MPIISIIGDNLINLDCHDKIAQAVAVISELEITTQDVTVIGVPSNGADKHSAYGKIVIAKIEDLFEKQERNEAVRQRLAEAVGQVLKNKYPKAKIEVFITSFNPNQGFWMHTPGQDS